MRKLALLLGLLLLAPAESQAQALQVVGQSGSFFKRYDAEDIDSISYNAYDGTSYNYRLTIHIKDGSEELFDRQNRNRIDSVVWYDPEGSILATLRQEGNYSNFIRLLEELDPALGFYGKMEGATDLTVFAANDAAWQRFFAENAKLPDTIPWSTATSYEALTDEQKQTLLFNAVFAPQRIRELEERTLRIPSIDKSKGLWTLVLTPAFCNKNKINDADQRILFGTTLNAPWMPNTPTASWKESPFPSSLLEQWQTSSAKTGRQTSLHTSWRKEPTSPLTQVRPAIQMLLVSNTTWQR